MPKLPNSIQRDEALIKASEGASTFTKLRAIPAFIRIAVAKRAYPEEYAAYEAKRG
jgi:hypothetical protein